MTARLSSLVLLAALLIVPATAKDKKKVYSARICFESHHRAGGG